MPDKAKVDDGSESILSSAELFDRTDAQLIARMRKLPVDRVDMHPTIFNELQRRGVTRLVESSRRLERLTWVLVALTLVLIFVGVPPAIELLHRWRLF